VSRELEKHKNNLEGLVSIRTEQLEILATIDDLTQAYNRRKFFELARYEIDRNARHQYPLSVMMIDIDHFKSINDLHGHQVGDKTLHILSNTISSVVRATDIFGRIGGEEFAYVLKMKNSLLSIT
jgi:diguanylate cyclase (GGDEF)-like protein